jgi:hypothetical protein
MTGDLDPEVAEFAKQWPPRPYCAETDRLARERIDAFDARVDEHAIKLEAAARRLGARVARAELTAAAAARQLDALAHAPIPEHPAGARWLPWHEAEAIAKGGFAQGIRETRGT